MFIAQDQSAYGNNNTEHVGSGNIFIQFHLSTTCVVVQNITSHGEGVGMPPLQTISLATPALPAGTRPKHMLSKLMLGLPGAAITRLLKERLCQPIFSF